MRIAPAVALLTLFAFSAATLPAEAQIERRRPQITIKKRSYLDAGTTVKPGSAKYHEYAFPLRSMYPAYSPFPDDERWRWPLPGPLDVPGF
jgi:hypothetical protein